MTAVTAVTAVSAVSAVSAPSRADVARTIAIQAVAELGRGVTVLDQEVAQGAPRREVLASLRLMRHALRTLEDAAMRDGRPS